MADSNFSLGGVIEKVVGTLAANLIVWGMPPVVAYLKSKSFRPWGIVLDTVVGWVCLYLLFYGFSTEGITPSTWWMCLVGSALLVVFLILDRVRSKQVDASASSAKADYDILVHFGSPIQRAKKQENESFWHIPVSFLSSLEKSEPATLPGCEFFLNEYAQDGSFSNQKPLMVGDVAFDTEILRAVDLMRGRMYLVPVAWRSEEDEARRGYITDSRFFKIPRECWYPLEPDRKKLRYRLGVRSGEKEYVSPHFYLLRVPCSASNGHFVLEMEYEAKSSKNNKP